VIFAGFINLFRPLVTCFLGLIVYHYIHVMKMAEPLDKPDLTFPFALRTFAGTWGLKGIILAGFLAAVMSATSALANSTATIFSLDIYKRIKKDATDRQMVWMGRLVSFLALATAGLIAPIVEKFGGIFLYFQQGITYLSTPIISIILMGILWKRANYASAIFGLIGGIVIQLLIVLCNYLFQWNLHWSYLAFIAEALIMASMAIVALNTAPPEESRWRPFWWRPSMLADCNEGTVRPWYQKASLWFSIYAVIWFYLYWRFW
jgi:solute:Na+ symporter, SSS family